MTEHGRAIIHRVQRCSYVVWRTDRLHEMLYGCRAFGFGRRHDRFDLLQIPDAGLHPGRDGQEVDNKGWSKFWSEWLLNPW